MHVCIEFHQSQCIKSFSDNDKKMPKMVARSFFLCVGFIIDQCMDPFQLQLERKIEKHDFIHEVIEGLLNDSGKQTIPNGHWPTPAPKGRYVLHYQKDRNNQPTICPECFEENQSFKKSAKWSIIKLLPWDIAVLFHTKVFNVEGPKV
jgi:hypothetical protein